MFSFFLSKHRNSFIFGFLFILSVSFMSFSSTKFSLTFKEVGETILYPFRFVFGGIWDGAAGLVNSFGEREKLKEALEQREKELIFYKRQFVEVEDLKKENEKLKNLLNYKQLESFDIESARIIGRDPEANFSSLTIDKGRKDGIEAGMPVFAYYNEGKGIVGIISESSFFTAKIKTIRNKDLAVGIYLPYAEIHGVVQGLGDNKNFMALLYIDKDISLNLGEKAIPSSEGDLFPKNILIGTVSYIDTTDKTRLTHKAYIKPYINLAQIEDVFVIKKSLEAKE